MGLFKKEKVYSVNVDMEKVVNEFANHLKNEGYKVQQKIEGNKAIIQAQKGGILRDIIAAERALTFTFEKLENGLKVSVGIGKWIQNLAVTAVEVIFLSELFLAVDVPEMLWNEHVENNLLKELDSIVSSYSSPSSSTTSTM
ncbi:MAG: hypothetical protein OWQ54_01945 [Sulfolobaceae archaeon]|nr:hypothetical protein [Sulfolobaceae archaeon]